MKGTGKRSRGLRRVAGVLGRMLVRLEEQGLKKTVKHYLKRAKLKWKRITSLRAPRSAEKLPMPGRHLRYSRKPFGESCCVSVIIPVYNAEKYLRRCLDSVFSQTFEDYEVICVDDGSTDGSLAILRRYEKKHRNMKVLSQANAGAGAARNNGLAIAGGTYVYSVDADDFIREDTLALTVARAEETGADLVLFGSTAYLQKKNKLQPMTYRLRTELLPSKDPFCYEDIPDRILQLTTGTVWDKLLRRDVIVQNRLEFPGYRTGEDSVFVYQYLLLARRITAVRETLYYQRTEHGGNLTAARAEQNSTEFLEAYSELQSRLRALGVYEAVRRSFANRALTACCHGMQLITDPEIRLQTEKRFLEEYLSRFDITGCSRTDFVSERWQRYYEDLCARHGIAPFTAPAVSVVVPMYNCEPFLDEFFTDLLNQTLKEIEIICVDDGSTDRTAEKAKEYASADPRVTLLQKENGGAGTARNLGITVARGDYLIFLDADDRYETDMLEKLYRAGQTHHADVVICQCRRQDFWKNEVLENTGYTRSGIPTNRTFALGDVKKLFLPFSPIPHNKFYRRRFVLEKDLAFSTTRISNDVKFVLLSLAVAERIVCLPDTLVTVRRYVNPSSISANRAKHLPQFITASRELYEELEKRGLAEQYLEAYCRKSGNNIWYNCQYADDDEVVRELAARFREAPWSRLEPEVMAKWLRLETMETRREQLEQLKKQEKSLAVQIRFAENQLNNVERAWQQHLSTTTEKGNDR